METLDEERKRNRSKVGGQDREGRVRSEGEQETHWGWAPGGEGWAPVVLRDILQPRGFA